jgi:hypothetical protein
MGKAVSDIREEGGKISFRFRDASTGITSLSADACPVAYYDLQGCMLPVPPAKGLYIIRYSDGTTRKLFR